MEKTITGRAWVFGDDVNTDIIYPGKYTYDQLGPADMAKHAMEDADPAFAGKVKKGDLIIAGKNFGCGSSREQAAACLTAAGISAVIAKSFARIYFRNAINLGLPVVQCPAAVEAIKAGDEVIVDFPGGVVRHGNQTYAFPALPESVMSILEKGGLVEYVKASLAKKS